MGSGLQILAQRELGIREIDFDILEIIQQIDYFHATRMSDEETSITYDKFNKKSTFQTHESWAMILILIKMIIYVI